MTVHIIGIDCATETAKVGVAFATWANGCTTVWNVSTGGASYGELDDTLTTWIRDKSEPVLLALDAPLGWPLGLRDALESHRAGDTVWIRDNLMFRRDTDREVYRRLGKTPLDVGADRIARTAHSALALLGRLRERLNDPIPLAWTWTELQQLSAIEVYPAATLTAYGIDSAGYKKPAGERERRELIRRLRDQLGARLTLRPSGDEMSANADALDAMLCVVGAGDFLDGMAVSPDAVQLATSARTEGWIWVSPPTRPPKRKSKRSTRRRR